MGFLRPSRRMNRVGAEAKDQQQNDEDDAAAAQNVSLIEHRKSAALAWYGRTEGSPKTALPRSSSRSSTGAAASRFRMEAYNLVDDHDQTNSPGGEVQIMLGNEKSSLLDAYEVHSFSKRLEEALIGSDSNPKLERSNSLFRSLGKKGNKIMWLCGKISVAIFSRSSKKLERSSCEKTKLL